MRQVCPLVFLIFLNDENFNLEIWLAVTLRVPYLASQLLNEGLCILLDSVTEPCSVLIFSGEFSFIEDAHSSAVGPRSSGTCG